jgi:tRNA A-37 threonylcarbamoyl transferase component Bud32/membrane-associated phospholipid phosphatase
VQTTEKQALRDVDAPGRLAPERVHLGRRRRRPSGEPPPLPRHLQTSGRNWAIFLGIVLAFYMLGAATSGAISRPIQVVDEAILDLVAQLRTSALTSVMRSVQALGSDWTIRVLAWAAILVPLVFKRIRHALVALGALVAVRAVTTGLAIILARPRPFTVEVLGRWEGFSHPSRPVATVAAALIGVVYTLVPHGRWRQLAKWGIAGVICALAGARVYLAVDNPFDALFGAVFGVAIPLVAFRTLVPNEVFPVVYKRSNAAHLDVSGERGRAIRQALEEQLGVVVRNLTPFGLEGSAGSTPLRIELEDEAGTVLFGKLYAANHLRADRWYKVGRTLMYGRLEDESRFTTVRHLVQYEDYMLRVMRAAGIPGAEPYGFVEITPEREYLLVTEFLAGAQEIGDAEVDEGVIDDAMTVVRRLWQAGVAHRDVKPSNVLVRDGRILLIDVAFGEVRPSSWRQAVDLANMMLTLALRCDVEKVYERAQQHFTPDEIAEAFSATRGVTSPSQLRSMMRADGRELLQQFRQLAPPRPPIRIQRWSVRRIALTGSVLTGTLIAIIVTTSILRDARLL